MMKRKFIYLCLAIFILPQSLFAGEEVVDQVESGEAGYKIGCSAAAAMAIPSCGDLASGRQFVQDGSSGRDKAEAAEFEKQKLDRQLRETSSTLPEYKEAPVPASTEPQVMKALVSVGIV